MKQFFRLLLISFALLLVLGVGGSQDDLKTTSASATEKVTLIAQSVIIPEASSELPLPLFSRWILLGAGSQSLTQQHEYFTATGVRTRLQFFRKLFLEYSPAIAEKKGILLILPALEGDHTRA